MTQGLNALVIGLSELLFGRICSNPLTFPLNRPRERAAFIEDFQAPLPEWRKERLKHRLAKRVGRLGLQVDGELLVRLAPRLLCPGYEGGPVAVRNRTLPMEPHTNGRGVNAELLCDGSPFDVEQLEQTKELEWCGELPDIVIMLPQRDRVTHTGRSPYE